MHRATLGGAPSACQRGQPLRRCTLVSAPLLTTALLGARGVSHGFTTRVGGVSTGPLAHLNLARRPGEQDACLGENWSRVAAALGRKAADVALLNQVHGARVAHVRSPAGPLACVADADAAVTDVPDLVLTVRTADCVPVLLAAPGAVAVAHAGWRGAAAGVVRAVVEALCALAGCSPGEVVAAVGPCVSGPAYEVGDEVVLALEKAGVARGAFATLVPGARPHVDVGAHVTTTLSQLGVPWERVRRCTGRDPALFSHRHDGPLTGRQAGVITLPG